MSKKRKIRADFRKNREVRTRQKDFTARDDDDQADAARPERIRAKGKLSRKRTLAGAQITADDSGTVVLPDVDPEKCRQGRVLRVQGLVSVVEDAAGNIIHCATRRLLKTISTDQRHVVATGDRVWFRPAEVPGVRSQESGIGDRNSLNPDPRLLNPLHSEGVIERVEPRRGVLSRTSRGRQHVIVANVDQLIIVSSAAEPRLKPNLIDRLLVTAERAHIRPLICINKIDLVDPADLMPLVGVYGQLGYQVMMTSAVTGCGVDRLRQAMIGKQSVVTGQSGVGKSSLLNAVQPNLKRLVRSVSQDSQKGRHTTSTAELIRLSIADCELRIAESIPNSEFRIPNSYVVDTPGIRQFELWDVIPEEVAGFFRDVRPYVSRCRYPDCTHTHEDDCAVKDAVADGWIDTRRYESYMQIRST